MGIKAPYPPSPYPPKAPYDNLNTQKILKPFNTPIVPMACKNIAKASLGDLQSLARGFPRRVISMSGSRIRAPSL